MSWLLAGTVLAATLFLSAFYSGAETGLYCANRVRLHVRAKQHDPRALRLAELFADTPRTLLVTLLGVNLADCLFTNAAAWCFDELLLFSEHEVEFYTIALVAPLVFVFANVLPKGVFQLRADRFMLASSRLLALSERLFRLTGVIWVLRQLAELMNRWLMDPDTEPAALDPKRKVAMLLQESLAGPALEAEQSELIDRVLQLSEMSLQSVMISAGRVVAIGTAAGREELIRIARNTTHARLPVYGHNRRHIVGVVSVNDLLAADDWKTIGDRVEPVMRLGPYDTVASALSALRQSGQELALVAEGNGPMLGIVTLRALLELLVGGLGA